MDFIRDIIDGFLGWTFDGDPEEFSCGCGCGCSVMIIVLGIVAGVAFWMGVNWE